MHARMLVLVLLLNLLVLSWYETGRALGQDKEAVLAGRPLKAWVADLQSKDGLTRIRAVATLASAGESAKPALPALRALLRVKEDDGAPLVLMTASALEKLGVDPVPDLLAALKEEAPRVRRNAALALESRARGNTSVLAALVAALDDRDTGVRTAVASTLGAMGTAGRPAVPALARHLDDPAAAIALWRIGKDVRGLPAMLAALEKQPTRALLTTLAEIGPRAKAALPTLRKLVEARDPAWRIESALAIFRIDGDADRAMANLQPRPGDEPALSPQRSVAALGTLTAHAPAVEKLAELVASNGPLAQEAAAALASPDAKLQGVRKVLEAGLAAPSAGVRWWCALALAASDLGLGRREADVVRVLRAGLFNRPEAEKTDFLQVEDPQRAVPALLAVLATRSGRLKLEAARTLGRLPGLDLSESLPALIKALDTDDRPLRRAIAGAMTETGQASLPTLTRLLNNPDPRLREAAARALAPMGQPAKPAIKSLTNLLRDDHSGVRTQAALAVFTLSGKAEQSLAVLNQVLKDVDNADRWEAIEVVAIIGLEAQPAIKGLTEVLVTALKDRDSRVRTQAARWLWRRVRQGKLIIPLLREAVSDSDVFARQTAIETLGEMGQEERAIALLIQALDDRELSVRLAAIEGLARSASPEQIASGLAAKSPRIRAGAAWALGLLGPEAKKVAGDLRKLAEDPDAEVREAVRQALVAVQASKS